MLLLVAVLALAGLTRPSLAAASTVADASFQGESPATGATYLVNEVGFTTTSALSESNGDSVTIEAPSGVTLDANAGDGAVNFYDTTANNSDFVSNATTSNNGSTITVPVPFNVPAGHQVYVELGNVSNPTSGSSGDWTVYTSTDTTPAMAGSQTFASSSVSDFSVTTSPSSANTTATYTVNFKLGNQLRPTDFQGQYLVDPSEIAFTAPPGASFNEQCNQYSDTLTDETNPTNTQGLSCDNISEAGNQITYSLEDAPVAAGDSVSIQINVNNPDATGEQPVSVSTSSDPTAADSTVDITPDTAVTDTSLQTESSAINASQLVDEVGFVATTALSQSGDSSITINAPSGVSLDPSDSSSALAVYDATTGASVQNVNNFGMSPDGSSISLDVPFDIAAGDHVYVELEDTSNPSSSGSGQWSVDTSSDLTPVYAGSPQTFADSSVSNFSIDASSTSPSATGVTYGAQFTTVSQLRADDWQNTTMDPSEASQIVFTAPDGVSFPGGCPSAQLTDWTNPGDSQTLSCGSASGHTITLLMNANVAAGDTVLVTIGGITNPSSSVAGQPVSLSTTSDPNSVSASLPTVVISDFRLSSPYSGESADRYVDLANVSSDPVSLSGWTLELADSSAHSTSIPLSGTIPAYGHLLVADSEYSTDSLASLAPADITHSFGSVEDIGGGVRLLDSSSDTVDAVGFAGAPTGYYSGTPLSLPTSLPSNVEYSWVRNNVAGIPSDTSDNAADFTYIAAGDAGNSTYGSPTLGTPGPLDLASATNHNDILQSTLLDPAAGEASPNHIYTPGSPGTLLLNRTIYNCSGQATTGNCVNAASGTTAANVTRLQFRITMLTTVGSPQVLSNQAVLVPETSSGGTVTDGGYTVQQLELAGGASTGGLNSVWQDPNVTGSTPLGPGSSTNVQFAFDVLTPGNFRFAYNQEDDLDPIKGTPSSSGGPSAGTAGEAPAETIVSGTITPSGKVVITSVRKGQRAALCTAAKPKTKKHGKKRRPRCVLAHIATRPHKKHRLRKKSPRAHIARSRDAAEPRRS